MGNIPWIIATNVGWGDALIDFLSWESKLLGIQHGAPSKRCFDMRFMHIADGYGGVSIRALRVEKGIKAIKLRGATCKGALLTPICYAGYMRH